MLGITDLSYLLFMIVLLPIVPAFILFKYLPSKAGAEGPFKKLQIKLGGAFAGYFVIALLLSGLLARYFMLVPEPAYELWTVKGHLLLDQVELKAEMFNIHPPDVDPEGGYFEIRGVPIHQENEGDVPRITIDIPDHGKVIIWLEEEPTFDVDYTVRRDLEKKTFVVSEISPSYTGPYPEEGGDVDPEPDTTQ